MNPGPGAISIVQLPIQPELRLVDLDALHEALEQADAELGLLSPEERSWTTPLATDVRRRRRSARIALRLLLHKHAVTAARGGALVVDGGGKPRLGAGGPAFSVAHSGGLALIALGPREPLGVDLETVRTVQLGPERRLQITAAGLTLARIPVPPAKDGPVGDAALLQAWTCLEAFAKADGRGIGALLTRLGLTATGARRSSLDRVVHEAEALRISAGLEVVALTLAPSLYGALARLPGDGFVPLVRALEAGECAT